MSARVTRSRIAAAVKARTGLSVELVKGDGYFYFGSDDPATGLILARCDSTSVYTMTLGGVSVDWWANRFDDILESGGDPGWWREELAKGPDRACSTGPIRLAFRRGRG